MLFLIFLCKTKNKDRYFADLERMLFNLSIVDNFYFFLVWPLKYLTVCLQIKSIQFFAEKLGIDISFPIVY